MLGKICKSLIERRLVFTAFSDGTFKIIRHNSGRYSLVKVKGVLAGSYKIFFLLRHHSLYISELAGAQWNEGDVFESVVRRVALPDACYALDGLFETFLTVLGEFGAFPAVIEAELQRYLPFLSTTKVLMAAVRHGVGREAAHEAIKEHAVAVALGMRAGAAENDLFERLAADPRLGLDLEQVRAAASDPLELTGSARDQVDAIAAQVAALARKYPEAAAYSPGAVL